MSDEPEKSSLYTGGGDTGKTSLLGGMRVAKSHPRMEAIGAIDELNSAIGVAIAQLDSADLAEMLTDIQNHLFNLGAELAAERHGRMTEALRTNEEQVHGLEVLIDQMDSQLPELKQFVLPGGHPAAAQLHVARSVCRRAERELVRLSESTPVNPQDIAYLNRLSDLLFVAAREVNRQHGLLDVPWRKG
ncbi:MAG TPA: cob(I)yrinic acid a,c-diamide adenosyltransferase [Dehalococcoidia bacterium]|nr:cob(I)yrinic acid a,c-diamide adenosyltransferase [Dehalococcoidia bacterium]